VVASGFILWRFLNAMIAPVVTGVSEPGTQRSARGCGVDEKRIANVPSGAADIIANCAAVAVSSLTVGVNVTGK